MTRKTPVTVPRHHRDQPTDEDLADILTAISYVARRLARRLTSFEQRLPREGGDPRYARKNPNAN